jgi:hypothetical protein
LLVVWFGFLGRLDLIGFKLKENFPIHLLRFQSPASHSALKPRGGNCLPASGSESNAIHHRAHASCNMVMLHHCTVSPKSTMDKMTFQMENLTVVPKLLTSGAKNPNCSLSHENERRLPLPVFSHQPAGQEWGLYATTAGEARIAAKMAITAITTSTSMNVKARHAFTP